MGRGVKGVAGALRAGGKVRRGRQASVVWGLPPCSFFTTSGHVDPKMRRTVIIPSKNNTEKVLSSINNHVMILTTLFIILFTTRRGCDGNSKRSFDSSYR